MRRRALLLLGASTLAVAWSGALTQFAPGSFSAHMTMHMGVVAVAAPTLALGVAGGRLDPVRLAPRLFSPIPASVVELVVVWAWHTPALHHAARHDPRALAVEQATFLLSGLLVWLSAFGGDARRRGERAAGGVVAMLLTSMHMTLLGALLALPPRPLFEHAHGGSWLTPLADQHLGGAIMLSVGGLVYLIAGLGLTTVLLRRGAGATAADVAAGDPS
ncbi:cytochrome c oxidase assembly protein [Nannocystis pusilla]|nr:cytochrome c oxidase assembly protein [Nannocystis pusilla]